MRRKHEIITKGKRAFAGVMAAAMLAATAAPAAYAEELPAAQTATEISTAETAQYADTDLPQIALYEGNEEETPPTETAPTMPEYGFVVKDVTEKTVYQAGDGTVTITPADGTNPTTIELNNATLVGPGKDVQNKPISASKIPTVLTFDLPEKQNTKVILTGENHITDFYDVFSTYGTNAGTSVEISGDGSLVVTDCTYFINSLCNVTFDGAKVDVNVTKGAIIAGVFNVSHSGITIKNQSDLKFTVAGGDDPDGFMAGDVTIDDSKVVIDTAGKYGIYNYFGFLASMLQGGGEFSGTTIHNSDVMISSAATPGYGGIFCYKSGDVTISNSKLNVTNGQNGIRVGNGNVRIDGDSDVSLNGSNVGIRIDTEGGLTVSDTASVYARAPYGIVTPSEVVLKDKTSLEIVSETAASNTAAVVNVQQYDPNGYYAAGNAAAASTDGADKWNDSDTLDTFRYFKLIPAGTSAGWSGIYDGQEHAISVTVPEGTTVEYSTDDVTYTSENPAYKNAAATPQTVYYRVLIGDAVVASGSEQVDIAPKPITVTSNAQSKYYSDDDPELTYTADALVEGDALQDIVLTRAEGEDVGEYAITATADADANPNYEITFENSIFTIMAKSIEDAKVVLGKGLTANGEEQTQTVEKVLLDDKEIPADSYTVTGNTATNPGSYTLTITAKGNYTGTFTWTYVVAPAKAEDAPGADIAIGKGTVKVAVKSEGNVPPTTLLTDKAELLAMLVDSGDITADELTQIANGASVDIVLTVKEANVTDEAKTAMAQAAKDYTIGQYLDISLFKYMTVDGVTQDGVALHTTKNALTIAVTVPDALINTNGAFNRTYCIVRYHDGTATMLDAAFGLNAKLNPDMRYRP